MAKSFRDQNQLFAFAALHALEYCERLFYLEEVEEIRIADERVYAGRTLHIELAEEESEEHLDTERRYLRMPEGVEHFSTGVKSPTLRTGVVISDAARR